MFAVEFKFDFRLHAFGHIPIDPLEAGQLARSIENGRCIRLKRAITTVLRTPPDQDTAASHDEHAGPP
jgi:hypothetical protein